MANTARSYRRPFRFALSADGHAPFLALDDRDLALDFLEWLGLGRPEFGAIDARELAPRCRRRLWPEPRNLRPFVRGGDEGLVRRRDAAELRRLAMCVVETLEGGREGGREGGLDGEAEDLVEFG